LLELSGIGRKSILSRYGIQTHVDLPVGENLQDHLMISLNFSLTSEAAGKVWNIFHCYNCSKPLKAVLKVIPVTGDAKPAPGKE